MLHFGIEWESVWYPNVPGRTFGEEIDAACGVMAQKVSCGVVVKGRSD